MTAPAETHCPGNVCCALKWELILGHLLKSCSRNSLQRRLFLLPFTRGSIHRMRTDFVSSRETQGWVTRCPVYKTTSPGGDGRLESLSIRAAQGTSQGGGKAPRLRGLTGNGEKAQLWDADTLQRTHSQSHGTFLNLVTSLFLWDKTRVYFSLTLMEIFFFPKRKTPEWRGRTSPDFRKNPNHNPFSDLAQLRKEREGADCMQSFSVSRKIKESR